MSAVDAAPAPPAVVTTTNYASFGQRLGAALLDGIIVSAIGFVLGLITQMADMQQLSGILSFLVSSVYYVYFIGKSGQTIGKRLLKIKVVKKGTMNNPDYVGAFLREVVGKLISAIVIMLGYFWMLWDKEKQTWHDKIADTVVVKVVG